MSNAYGSWQVQGLQDFTSSGVNVSLGPYSVAFSDTNELGSVLVNTTATIAVPSSAQGILLLPPLNTGSVAVQFKTVSGDTGTYISPQLPTIVTFDTITPNVPANVYLVSASSVSVYYQFL